MLKRKRAGERAVSADGNSEDEDPTDEEDAPQHMTARSMFAAEQEDEDFVSDGEDDTLGVPADLPLEFTRYASMKAKDLFRHVVDWMVQKKLNPGFNQDDELYRLAFQKLNDEVRGLAGSKFMSAAWTPVFQLALRARPSIGLAPIDRNSAQHFMRDKCDACNRTGHPATWEVQFQGKPYHRESLEELGNEDDDSEPDSDDDGSVQGRPARDAEGREIVPESTTFYVGKFCMANAETAHALSHWRFHLYEWVVGWLETAGYNTPEKIVQRDKWNERKRRKKANKVVDDMEAQGKIKELYRDFKSELDTARNAKQGRYASSP